MANVSRLTSSNGLTVAPSYQYDLDGNRTSKVEGGTTTTYTYDRADQVANQVIGATTRTYDYDRYGNLLTSADNTSAVTTYAYDEASRLTTINPPTGGQVTFTVDALDRHATRALGSPPVTTDTYAYLDATETAWQTGQGTTTSSLLDADGSRLAVKTGSTVSWLLFDLHGSVVAMCTSGTSTITDAYRFDGFGQQIQISGTSTNPWRYRGLLNIGADSLAGVLLDMGARDYSPQLGAFTQLDSVQGSAANPMTMNRFLYALANPATLIDPDGHMPAPMEVGGYVPPQAHSGDGSDCSGACLGAGGTAGSSNGPSGSSPSGRTEPCTTRACWRTFTGNQGTPMNPEFAQGVKDAAIWSAFTLLLAGVCIAATGGACTPFVLTLGAGYAVKAGADAYTTHGIHLGPVNVGGSEPWTPYEQGNMVVAGMTFAAGYGLTKFGLPQRGSGIPRSSSGVSAGSGGAAWAPATSTVWGEQFVRVAVDPSHLRWSFEHPGGTLPGTFAFPKATFDAIGPDPMLLKLLGDLPGAPPTVYRLLEPPEGTPNPAGHRSRRAVRRTGGVPEVLFPGGF